MTATVPGQGWQVALGESVGIDTGHVRIAVRTLVLELGRARGRNALRGDTPQERFAYFCRTLDRDDLFARYPVLAQLLVQAAQQSTDSGRELADRFAADRALITETLFDGVDPGDPVAIETGQGDAHRGGRSVSVLRFADGRRLVYRPRPITLHAHFNDQLAWLSERTSITLRSLRLLPRDGYGWLEFVAPTPCADVAAVNAFYRRLGALLALVYALDGTDMHCENLIACGDQPVLVDVETLFHPTLPITDDPANLALARSVQRTALLPLVMLGDNGAVDISGVGGDDGAPLPVDVVSWVDAGTDRMRLARVPGTAAGRHNRPVFDGKAVEPTDHEVALLAGFDLAYDAIALHRDELLDLIGACTDDETRVIARPTRLYATLLDESTHPEVLRDPADRDRFFSTLDDLSQDHPLLRALVRHETRELWAGDIPLFTTRPGSRDLWTSTGERLPDLLPHDGLTAVRTKIAAMGDIDRCDQRWVIRAALGSRSGPVRHSGDERRHCANTVVPPDQQRLLTAACGIGDMILAHASVGPDRTNWMGLELVDDRYWAVMSLGAGFSTGYTGVALFLAQLGELTGGTRYLDAAHAALRPISGLLRSFAAAPDLVRAVGPGGFHGLGGIAYALARMASLLDMDTNLVDGTVSLMPDCAEFAVVDGIAGAAVAMRSVHAETGSTEAARLAERYTDQLSRIPLSEGGFARGVAGADWALGIPARGAVGVDMGWCSGVAGMVLAGADRLPGPEPLRDMSLCHGELGVLEALVLLAERGRDDARSLLTRRTGLLLGTLDQRGPRCGTPGGVPSPGLLTGLAGIGYGLLRLGFGVPSVLSLAPSAERSRWNRRRGEDGWE
ncbi:type 2 lanthipeptide synthetase LanM family protein [Actinokineospora diospyrosa]|uniref:Type 2 lantibiotic biosynthesis protein LanM n=1 Tax=Actinokineospora diospyrosa TaxID=103728 RepID=A0ABT1I5I6_9PSEU|nr:type 2 lanthipeptide synthetase LanM family protein [Actinokineospora diospyrosa]MCP2267895.1 type 2 lantibiotic biosynthesis protein LanM [Actinokineospora diospyrosa]